MNLQVVSSRSSRFDRVIAIGKSQSTAVSSRNSSRNSVSQHGGGAGGTSNAARRMLSAGRVKINELRNKVSELTIQLANVQAENKQYQRQLKQQVR
jgi:molecular chaperone GrpE (heat shock protein)